MLFDATHDTIQSVSVKICNYDIFKEYKMGEIHMITLYSTDFDHNSKKSLYIQLYECILREILTGNVGKGEKLPSLRSLSTMTGLSLTTASLAYDQLQTEGYIYSRPQSGYFVAELPKTAGYEQKKAGSGLIEYTKPSSKGLYDLSAFDFRGWKKCVDRVYNDYAHMLLTDSDPKGEAALRFEIARYVREARGVSASPEQMVIGAGTQQLTTRLARILKKLPINLISVESPGYLPIQQMLKDNGFDLLNVPVTEDGIDPDRLPINISSAVYVSPANQFPTGAVMPAANRYKLLEWAKENNSIIIEDDYNSELRYFGRPIPALQGMDHSGSVVYLGSFSSTLFPAIRISYMILPERLMQICETEINFYQQTCSKTEQLALALFMEEGSYHRNIRKIRTLYSKKLQQTVAAFEKYGKGLVIPFDTKSGISLLLQTVPGLDPDRFCRIADRLGVRAAPTDTSVIIYYNRIPFENIDNIICELCKAYRDSNDTVS